LCCEHDDDEDDDDNDDDDDDEDDDDDHGDNADSVSENAHYLTLFSQQPQQLNFRERLHVGVAWAQKHAARGLAVPTSRKNQRFCIVCSDASLQNLMVEP
jgi:hypothetical protein